ncbi:hypothetical protein IKG38_01925 [Candidatus Saccharibacteria bacterium]|nr:hypothetical protein [Candidatus Saccharibacteria bacterium]MBR4625019.1 hypothetical protein [Alphaproteobacteria bacterium]
MSAEKKKQRSVLILVVGLVVVLMGSVLFVGAVSGWFSDMKVELEPEYYCKEECDGELLDLSGEQYEELVNSKKSFVVFVDQSGCVTAEKLKGYIKDYAKEVGIKPYIILFSEAKNTSLHDHVKYYPSVAIVSRGRIVNYLRADNDNDSDYYNDYNEFRKWISQYL